MRVWDTWAVAFWDWHEKVRLQASYEPRMGTCGADSDLKFDAKMP